jgi:hypothetical protein
MAAGSRRTTPRRLPVYVAAIGIGAAVAFAATRLGGDDTPARTSTAAADAAVAVDEIGHVHGIGRDPADGTWYLATHSGLLHRNAEGTLSRVAGRFQDTMGFTVVGPQRFLGSGHPDLREDLPSSLGLISSDDAGASWEPVSLLGEADLHAIVPAGDRLYAADASASRLLVSDDDGRTWSTRAAVELMALAVDPEVPARLVGVTYDGTAVASSDAGSTFEPMGGASFTSVVWTTAPVAADANGRVFELRDRAWEQIGEVGTPEPTLGTDGEVLAAAGSDGRLLFSDDGGRTWTGNDPQDAKSSGREENSSAQPAEQNHQCSPSSSSRVPPGGRTRMRHTGSTCAPA